MRSNVASLPLQVLVGVLVACSSGKHAENASADAGGGKDHTGSHTAQASMPDAMAAKDAGTTPATEVAIDAGNPAEASYTIYPVDGDECPGKPFPPGFEVRPTHVCGAGRPCHDEGCHSAADCTARPRGRCAGFDEGAGAIEFTRCIYEECESHADCDAGSVCLCAGGWRFCVLADCLSDAECPAGEHCIRVDAPCTPGPFFVCTKPADQCRTASDCPGNNACLTTQRGTPLSCATLICGD